MNTLEQHNEELLNDFNIIFGTDNEFVLGDNSIDRVKVFIQDQNKQLYIKIAEGEIERLLELDSNPYPFSVNPDKPMSHIYKNIGFTKSLESQLTHWENILTELKK